MSSEIVLIDLLETFLKLLDETGLRQYSSENTSENTRKDYIKTSMSLIRSSDGATAAILAAVKNTKRMTTFRKRIAAMRYLAALHASSLPAECFKCSCAADEAAFKAHMIFATQLLMILKDLQNFQLSERRVRKSKAEAMLGLPDNWREKICARGANGKYANALLVLALSGCRPDELVRGVQVTVSRDCKDEAVINLEIIGSKVKTGQGQVWRQIQYSCADTHPLVASLLDRLSQEKVQDLTVSIESAVNLTCEVRRLAESAFPSHPFPITAYCFRHQWAADMKRGGPGDATSQGLGHLSSKTTRSYGSASRQGQGRPLTPLSVKASLELKHRAVSRFGCRVEAEGTPTLSL